MGRLLADAGHQDKGLISDIAHGFDLTGQLPEANVFSKHFRPATLSCPELRKFASISREAIINSIGSSGDPELDEGLMKATQKEISKGFLLGPI